MLCSNCGNKIADGDIITSGNEAYCYEPDCALKAEENEWMLFGETLNEVNDYRFLPVESRICVISCV